MTGGRLSDLWPRCESQKSLRRAGTLDTLSIKAPHINVQFKSLFVGISTVQYIGREASVT